MERRGGGNKSCQVTSMFYSFVRLAPYLSSNCGHFCHLAISTDCYKKLQFIF